MTKIDPAEDHLILASKVELINYETDQQKQFAPNSIELISGSLVFAKSYHFCILFSKFE